MMSGWLTASTDELLVLGAAIATSAIAIVFARLAATSAARFANILTFLAGVVLLLVSLGHLAPEAFAEGTLARVLLIGGILLGLLIERAFRSHSHVPSRFMPGAAIMGLVALGVHSTLDGAVYAATFAHDEQSGLLVSVGLILHEAPEGVVAYLLAHQVGWSRARAIFAALVASTFTTPLGWALAHLSWNGAEHMQSLLFSVSGGLLIYVGVRLAIGGWRSLQRREV
ncbi:MAG: ZIP family metal transporter [Hyphomonadaceae bacterium]